MSFRLELYDKDLNFYGVTREVEILSIDEQMNGLGSMILRIPTYICNTFAEFKQSKLICDDFFKTPFQLNAKLISEDCESEVFHGWNFRFSGDENYTTIEFLNIRFYLQKKVIQLSRTVSGTPQAILSSLNSTLQNETTSNFIKFTGTEIDNLSLEVKVGQTLAQVLDEIVELGYEYKFKNNEVVISKDIGEVVRKPLVYNCRDNSGLNIDYTPNFLISGENSANHVITNSDNGEFEASNVPSGYDYISSFRDYDSQEKADALVNSKSGGYSEYKVTLLPEKWCLGEIRAGDYVNVSIKIDSDDCGLFNKRETIRVKSINSRVEDQLIIDLTLSNDPLDLKAQASLAQRIKKLEDKTF